MTANRPMTGEQLDELMTIAVNMQRDSEKVSDRPAAMFAYAVQVAVLELRKVRNEAAALAAENAGIKAAIDATIRWQQSTDPENVESVRMLVDVKTPATDAFLAEVRASAITDALKSLDVVFDTDCVMESNGISYEDAEQRTAGAYAVSKALEDFAAQIRKGVRS
ncbi:hypothetical protein [Enterobacter hormaechei]|uniref:hypothetical protein n=1 Tax=Enterobacter hormaechei TaxID=158836 RepID=UPI00207C133F|nr:hypothetical protein [Enterobacter hormaechei]MCO4125438.1 hypothetical protein [Enterobacter hormaechei]MCO4134229.1 hypothetical protein [Enterobacter hormaechei subsp. xiangfangensis]MCO4142672.1 hypothetical protein [Enterobacter hormaechei]